MKKYVKFKETELGKIPNDWEEIPLGKMGELKNGINFSREDFGAGFPVINVTNLFRGKYATINDLAEIKKESINKPEKYFVKKGDILFTRSSLKHTGTGQAAMVHFLPDKPTLFSGFIIRFRKNKDAKIVDEYLNYLLRSTVYRKYIQRIISGTTITNINQDFLSKMPIILPPLSEQNAIVKILSDIDSKIELNKRINSNLEKMSKSLFKSWFIDFEFQNKNGKPYKSNGGELINSELGKIPIGWQIVKLSDIVEVRGGTTPDTTNPEYWNGHIPWITPKDITSTGRKHFYKTARYITTKGFGEIANGLIPPKSVLLTSRAPIGKIAINEVPIVTNQGFINIECKKISHLFLYYWLQANMDRLISYANGTTFLELSKSSFKKIQFVLPEKNIIDKFDKIVYSLDEKVRVNELENDALIQLKDLLLPKLMSGELRVNIPQQVEAV